MGDLAPGLAQNLWVTAAALLACVLLLWLLSIRLRDISIIDIFWGPAFGVDALVGYALADGQCDEVRRTLVTEIGVDLFTRHAFAFEATSILILVAMVGAVVIARKER